MRALLIVYDNESYIHQFPQGLAYISSVLKDCGVDVEIYSQDIHHYPDDDLTLRLNCSQYDIVGISVIGGYYQYRKLLSLSKAVNASKNRHRFNFIIGGHGPTPDPTYFLKKTQADIVVMGEGEETIRDILLVQNLSEIKGIAYRSGDTVTINPRRELIKDLNGLLWPDYDSFPMEVYRLFRLPNATSSDFVFPILSARGCKFKCNFCYRMDEGYRVRSPEDVINEIKYLYYRYRINYIHFFEELFMGSEARTTEMCEAIIKSGLNIKFCCDGRLNFAKPKVLKLMKRAGCVFVNYGIESMDDDVLKKMNKGLTVKQIEKGIKNTADAGISPGINILFGHIGDTVETMRKGFEFVMDSIDGSQLRTIRPVTPYPGSALFDLAVKQGKIKDVEDFYENVHVNSDLVSVQFSDLTDDEVHDQLNWANTNLIEEYFDMAYQKAGEQCHSLYLNRDASFRGFRQV